VLQNLRALAGAREGNAQNLAYASFRAIRHEHDQVLVGIASGALHGGDQLPTVR